MKIMFKLPITLLLFAFIYFSVLYVSCAGNSVKDQDQLMLALLKSDSLENISNSRNLNNLKLFDRNGHSLDIYSLISSSPGSSLIFHYSQNCCRPCVDHFLERLSGFSKKSSLDIVYIGYRLTEMESLSRHASIGFDKRHFRTSDYLNLPINDTLDSRPFLFLVDHNGEIQYAKICHIDDPEFDPYLAAVKLHLVDGNQSSNGAKK